jgi:molecular chaperone DnaK
VGRTIGIDLGTTRSAVACVNPLGRPEILRNARGERTTPSVVLFEESGPLVGSRARAIASVAGLDAVWHVKQFLGNADWRFDTADGRSYRAEEIAALILLQLRRDAERVLRESVTEAVLTVPSYFDARQRRATLDAGQRAGLTVRRLLDEPIAAALSHGYDGRGGGYTLVFDLGGVGCAVTALRVGPGEFDVLAVADGRGPGGVDWDDELVGLLRRKLLEAGGVSRLDGAGLEAALRAQAERTRHRLSRVDRASARLHGSGVAHPVAVSRAEFERATAHLLGRSRSRVESVMRESGLAWIDVDHLLVVGGATRMPMVRRMLEGTSGLRLVTSARPEEEIALGAAIQAHLFEADGRGSASKWAPLLSRPPSGADLARHRRRQHGAASAVRRKGPFCEAARRPPAPGAARSAVTIARLESLRPDSRVGLMRGVESLLGVGDFRRIERHNTRSVGFITEATDVPLFVKAEYGECSATHREADWYARVARRLSHSTTYIASACGRNHAVVVLRYLRRAGVPRQPSLPPRGTDPGGLPRSRRRLDPNTERPALCPGAVRGGRALLRDAPAPRGGSRGDHRAVPHRLSRFPAAVGNTGGAVMGSWSPPPSEAILPDCRDSLNRAREVLGLPPIDDERLMFEGDISLVPSTPELDPLPHGAGNTRFVGLIGAPEAQAGPVRKLNGGRFNGYSYVGEPTRPSFGFERLLDQVVAELPDVGFHIVGDPDGYRGAAVSRRRAEGSVVLERSDAAAVAAARHAPTRPRRATRPGEPRPPC